MQFRGYLAADYRRLDEVAKGDLTSRVPTCPEWTLNDLLNHVAVVYLHKVECMRHNAAPNPWPPSGLDQGSQVDLLARAYAELDAEFAARAADSPAFTWYGPDQTVGFWLRRMAHETVIHRIDAELAAGVDSVPIPQELALDGIDEILKISLAWASEQWPEDFQLDGVTSGSVGVSAGGRRWHIAWAPDGLVRVTDGGDPADAECSGEADVLMRWAWRRADGPVEVTGDESKVDQFRRLLYAATQ